MVPRSTCPCTARCSPVARIPASRDPGRGNRIGSGAPATSLAARLRVTRVWRQLPGGSGGSCSSDSLAALSPPGAPRQRREVLRRRSGAGWGGAAGGPRPGSPGCPPGGGPMLRAPAPSVVGAHGMIPQASESVPRRGKGYKQPDLLGGLDSADRAAVLAFATPRQFRKRSHLYTQGEQPMSVHVVTSGLVPPTTRDPGESSSPSACGHPETSSALRTSSAPAASCRRSPTPTSRRRSSRSTLWIKPVGGSRTSASRSSRPSASRSAG